MKGKDLTGQQFGYLYVEELALNYAKENNLINKHLFWKCKCICGREIYCSSSNLISGKTTSCGCKFPKIIDYTGQKMGWLTVESIDMNYTDQYKKEHPTWRRIFWRCKCNCGATCFRSSDYFRRAKTPRCPECAKIKDITGERHGKLVAQYYVGKKNNRGIWHCKCDCGNEKDLTIDLFRLVDSCGCSKVSRTSIGERHIKEILEKNNIKYIYDEAYFDDLISIKGIKARYDFILLDKDDNILRIIEFDGIQHYDKTCMFYSPEQCENDRIKNEYAKNHNYPLVRIPYQERDHITLEMLMSDKYLVK